MPGQSQRPRRCSMSIAQVVDQEITDLRSVGYRVLVLPLAEQHETRLQIRQENPLPNSGSSVPAIPINLPAREAFASFSAGPGSTVLLPLPWCARPSALVDAHDAPRPCGY